MNMIQKILQSMAVKALSNGVFTAVPCPQDGVTNRLKVYVQTRAAGFQPILSRAVCMATNRARSSVTKPRASPSAVKSNFPSCLSWS